MYTRKYIDIITLIIVTIILILINVYQIKNQSNIEKMLKQEKVGAIEEVSKEENKANVQNTNAFINNIQIDKSAIDIETDDEDFVEDFFEPEIDVEEVCPENWFIKIPKIDLVAKIEQGTSDTILKKAVGHFEESPTLNGNICLAAHNRGYNVNFFEKIKNLLLNDIIIYQYGNIQKTYSVSNITIINEEDWSYIESSDGNKITLITCVENEPEYRLCVQAQEIK